MRGRLLATAWLAGCAGATPAVAPPAPPPDATVQAVAPPEGGSAAPAPDPRAIARAIVALGAPRPHARARAEEILVTAGAAAVPALRRATEADDPELAARARRVLEVLGEEGPYATAVAAVRDERFGEAQRALDAYLRFGRGAYRRQAEYLVGEVGYLLGAREVPGGVTARLEWIHRASAEALWNDAMHHHNLFLFLRGRDLPADGFLERARAGYDLALLRQPAHRRAWVCRAALLAAAGLPEEARESLARAEALPESGGWDAMDLACYHAAAGNLEAALSTLATAIPACIRERDAARARGVPAEALPPEPRWWARESNDFDALRDEPGFRALVDDPTGA